jgi:hypothetical protein
VKKLVTIIMILLFGVSSSGATIQFHYCCGKLKTVSWGHVQEKDCGMQGKMGSKPCCETKSISAKEQAKGHEFYSISFGTTAPVEPPILYQDIPALILQEQGTARPVIHSSPPLAEDIFILNCVFRI